jgi:hypothetical protein
VAAQSGQLDFTGGPGRLAGYFQVLVVHEAPSLKFSGGFSNRVNILQIKFRENLNNRPVRVFRLTLNPKNLFRLDLFI